MAGGIVKSVDGGGGDRKYTGSVTPYVITACVIGALGGLLFGYDIGISGGVTAMPTFLKKFFPAVYKKEEGIVATNQYCTFDSQILTLFTSSLYLAALVSCFVASWLTKKIGRRWCIFCGSIVFFSGALLNFFATNVLMLIFGRILLGVGVGFENQAVPLYLSEMAPYRFRGAINIGFQLAVTLGIFTANLVNFGTNKMHGDMGWRLSLGAAAIPALMITVGALFLPDTPSSLINRDKNEKAKKILQEIRGTANVDNEFNDMLEARTELNNVASEQSWRTIFSRNCRPQLVAAFCIPVFQQLTGINVIMFYAPVLFKTLGSGSDSSLVQALVIGGVNVVATFIAQFSVDKKGRKFLFKWGGIVMFCCQVIIGILIAVKFGTAGVATIPSWYAYILLALICLYVAAFASSWGPLGWLVPSEIFPLEIRATGQGINVGVNMLATFVVAQLFTKTLCLLKFGLFFLFALFVLTMSVLVMMFLPETKDIPIEEVSKLWKKHWFWKRFTADDDDNKSPV